MYANLRHWDFRSPTIGVGCSHQNVLERNPKLLRREEVTAGDMNSEFEIQDLGTRTPTLDQLFPAPEGATLLPDFLPLGIPNFSHFKEPPHEKD
jgi:hypothetical protein